MHCYPLVDPNVLTKTYGFSQETPDQPMSRAQRSTFAFGDYRLIPEEGVVLRQGQPVAIPPKAFETLVVLVHRRGHVVSKADLLAAVWPDTVVEEANLTQNISTLRKALDEPGESSCIATHPKRGYRFVAPVDETSGDEAPESAEKPAAVDSQNVSLAPYPRGPIAIAVAAALVVVAITVGFALRGRAPTPMGASERIMLAVLPFQNLSGDAEQEFVSDGFTEETIARLGNLNPARLGVIARTSVMSYKDTAQSVAEIGSELGVEFVIEGSIRREGEVVRVTVQLVRAMDQTHLWADSFEGDWAGILEFQKQTAQGIARTLTVELLADDAGDRGARASTDPRAYEAYLKGRYFWNKRNLDGFLKSEELYQQALTLDPDFALAHSGLADTYLMMRSYNYASAEILPRIERSARRAIELDPRLAAPHATLSGVLMAARDFEGGRRELLRAMELDPNYATARQWYAAFLTMMGRSPEAVVEIEHALELDPLSLRMIVDKARILYFAGSYDDAVEQCLRALEMDPTFGSARFQLGLTLLELGQHDAAIAELERAANGRPSFWLGYGYARLGRDVEAREMLARLRLIWETEGTFAGAVALVYTGLGEVDRAFEWLEIGFEDRDPSLDSLKAWPYWESLRDDPRYTDLLRRLNLPLG